MTTYAEISAMAEADGGGLTAVDAMLIALRNAKTPPPDKHLSYNDTQRAIAVEVLNALPPNWELAPHIHRWGDHLVLTVNPPIHQRACMTCGKRQRLETATWRD